MVIDLYPNHWPKITAPHPHGAGGYPPDSMVTGTTRTGETSPRWAAWGNKRFSHVRFPKIMRTAAHLTKNAMKSFDVSWTNGENHEELEALGSPFSDKPRVKWPPSAEMMPCPWPVVCCMPIKMPAMYGVSSDRIQNVFLRMLKSWIRSVQL